ncbi:MAG: hypothetical protein ACYTGC_06585 [Planctomycetota bacterium]
MQCQTLFAGQTIDAGTVCVEIVGSDLVVTYATTGGWELVETHLWVGTDIGDMPQTRKGNPRIGHFPYGFDDLAGATSSAMAIPLEELGFQCPAENATIFVAAHAALRLSDGGGGFQTETGWADGDRFVEQGSWGTFFSTEVSCDCGGAPVERSCETAFAYGDDLATCFLAIDEDSDGIEDFNRWGWTNQIAEPDVYMFAIYAGAGRCDTTKGTLVGTLTVIYAGGLVDVIFTMNDGYEADEVHVYVGSEILARNVNDEYTVAPGQYPYVADDLAGASSHAVMGIPVTGPFHVVAHAVACSESWPE